MLIRMKRLSLDSKRAIVGIAMVPLIVCGLNSLFRWHLFGSFDKGALVLSAVVLVLVMRYLGPTIQEMRDYRDMRAREAEQEYLNEEDRK